MSGTDSVTGSAGRGETAPAGAMHLAGGSHADAPAGPGMQFFGGSQPGMALQVEFVDLSAQGAGSATGASVAGGAAEFGVVLNSAHVGLPADFSTGPGAGVPGAMQSRAASGVGSGALPDLALSPMRVPLKLPG